ncbi:unnamed protein product [Soboliphyme baturini]|uniref:alpha-L-fucosidase n=1 Tax=Soboliphyme baturini TaxID=241478 RepID=A0A183JAF1_9BILA|nr:unnamed protein product [Soboliphyme baturini]
MDLVGQLEKSIRKAGIKFGLYFSLLDWFHPLYLEDKNRSFKTQKYIELEEIVTTYNPDIVWSDGDWEGGADYWNSTHFLAWLYNDSPVKDLVVVNDRWGAEANCKHGDFFSCSDRYSPGILQKHKWENCMTVDRSSWGFRRTATLADILTIEELIAELAKTIR